MEKRLYKQVMKKMSFKWVRFPLMSLGVILPLLSVLSAGCSPGKMSERMAVTAFKQEVRETVQNLSLVLTEPVSKGDKAAVRAILSQICHYGSNPPWRPVTCSIVVLNQDGTLIASTSSKGGEDYPFDYSKLDNVSKALTHGKTIQASLDGPKGSTICVVLKPLVKEGKIIGLLGLGFESQELSKTKGVSEEEFMALNLNNF